MGAPSSLLRGWGMDRQNVETKTRIRASHKRPRVVLPDRRVSLPSDSLVDMPAPAPGHSENFLEGSKSCYR